MKDVLGLALTAFGGPQVHLTYFFKILVHKRSYLSEHELLNLYSFCQILPGPASTQTITAVGFRIGGPRLAFLTLLVWILPAVTCMILAALAIAHFDLKGSGMHFTKYLEPIAIGFIVFAAIKLGKLAIKDYFTTILFSMAILLAYLVQNPAIFPVILIFCGLIAAIKHKKNKPEEKFQKFAIEWDNLILFLGIALGSALLGHLTRYLPNGDFVSLTLRLFENFFRNGSIVFGGGQTLIAVLHKQFVEFKGYLSNEEFLSGYALIQVIPGPIFSFSSYVGSLAMRQYGAYGQIVGGVVGAIGIFLPGAILIFFVIRFWDKVKSNSILMAAIIGVNAGSAGLLAITAFILSKSVEVNLINALVVAFTFFLLQFTKFPAPLIIVIGLLAGVFI